jgi:integral membrane protein (TIGR01906 family)
VRLLNYVLWWFFICCMPLFLIASTIRWGINEIRLYEYGVDTYQISNASGIAKPELMKIYQHLIYYYNSKVDTAQVTVEKAGEKLDVFSEKELIHLKDVKGLMQLDYTVQIAALVIILICVLMLLLWLQSNWRVVVKGLFWGSVITFGLVVFLILWSVFGFEQLFILFHLVSFTNELWIIDPSEGSFLVLFPGGFFYDAALFGFGALIIESLVLAGVAFGVTRLNIQK